MNQSLALFEDPPPDVEVDALPGVDATPPRVYRARILKLRSAEQRREALASIADPGTRAVVRFYVEDHFARLHRRALPDMTRIEAEEGVSTRKEKPCKQ